MFSPYFIAIFLINGIDINEVPPSKVLGVPGHVVTGRSLSEGKMSVSPDQRHAANLKRRSISDGRERHQCERKLHVRSQFMMAPEPDGSDAADTVNIAREQRAIALIEPFSALRIAQ